MKPAKPGWHPKPTRLKLSRIATEILSPNFYAVQFARKCNAPRGWPETFRAGAAPFKPRLNADERRAVRRWRKRALRGSHGPIIVEQAIRSILEYSWLRQAAEYERTKAIARLWISRVVQFAGVRRERVRPHIQNQMPIDPALAKHIAEAYGVDVAPDVTVSLCAPNLTLDRAFPYQGYRTHHVATTQ